MALNTTLVLILIMAELSLNAADIYPGYQGAKHPIDESKIEQSIDRSLLSLALSGDKTADKNIISKQISSLEKAIPNKTWDVIKPVGRMALPSVLITPVRWNEDNSVFRYLSDDPAIQADMATYVFLWPMLVNVDATGSFQLISRRLNDPNVSTLDILRFRASVGSYWPGEPLEVKLPKQTWEALHNSANPCYRLMALGYFASVDLSPDELLSTYRECLFNGCSYTELLALEAILRTRDYRANVVKLLQEYLASNPPINDGTLSPTRSNFPVLSKGALSLISNIQAQVQQPAIPVKGAK